MSYAVADTVSFIATFRNPDGSAATGLTVTAFSKDAYTKAGAAITFPTLSAFAEIGVTGRYRATAVVAAAGDYTVIARAAGAYTFPDYECVADVVTAAQADPLGASVAGYAAGTAGARLALLGSGSSVVTSPVSADAETLTLIQGDDHTVANGNPIEFTEPEDGPSWPVLTGATVALVITDLGNAEVIDDAGVIVTATGDAKQVRFELTAAQTATLTASRAVALYRFGVVMTLSGETRTLVRGSVMVNRDQSP